MTQHDSKTYHNMDLLRFTTAGSVDDGKSTLIGRLLYDSKAVFEDQLEAVELASKQKREEHVNLALLTDGLRAEREQGITIDVAYRYFATPKRKFIIADTPGHIQYTRNMVTGASTANLAIVLIDARNGVLTQSKRHGFLASLLQIPHMIVAVNKMDLVEYREERFNEIVAEYEDFCQKLDIHDITFIPISALVGDNVVHRSENMPWYLGDPLLNHLENVHILADRNLVDFRFPVQTVIRPHQDYRGFAGLISSGTIKQGEEILSLPSGTTSRVKSIDTYNASLDEAFAGQSVTITLDDEIDISRGDMIVRSKNVPTVSDEFEAILCWMHQNPMQAGKNYIIQHTTQSVKGYMKRIEYKVDIDTLHREKTDRFELNEIGRVTVKTSKPLFLDAYKNNHATGSFIVVDPDTFVTVGAGMIRGVAQSLDDIRGESQKYVRRSPNVQWESGIIHRDSWESRNQHKAAVFWFTGLSGSGKSTIAKTFVNTLFEAGKQVMQLDGDNVRHGLCGDLGFSDEDRAENIRRVGEAAKLFFDQGNIVVCTFISPFKRDRDFVRSLFPAGSFFEIYVNASLDTCEQRDPKGLYKRVRSGEISEFTGISSPYEKPEFPEMVLDTDNSEQAECLGRLKQLIIDRGIVDAL